MKNLLSIILLTLPIAVMANNFTGNDITISAESWADGTTNIGSNVNVKPFYYSGADVYGFKMGSPANLWDIRFHMSSAEKIDLIYRKPTGTTETPYDYDTDLGFHFQDVEGTWRPIIGVTASTPFGPKGFDPSLIRFDENNIYINLKGSSCGPWYCSNPSSPTGLNNTITLHVQFEGNRNLYLYDEIDMLFDWLEVNRSQYFPHRSTTHYDLRSARGRLARMYSDGIMVFNYPNIVKTEEYFFETRTISFEDVDSWMAEAGIDRHFANKRDAARKAAKEEKARQAAEKARLEEEARLAKIAWQEAHRGPYDPYHEESDSYDEPLDFYGEGLDDDAEPLDFDDEPLDDDDEPLDDDDEPLDDDDEPLDDDDEPLD